MSVRRDKKNRKWFYRKRIKLPDGRRVDICGYPTLNTKLEAERSERAHIQRAFDDFHNPPVETKEVPTFDDWFNGRYMTEWVAANKPGTAEEKRNAYEYRLKRAFGHLRLDEIGVAELNEFRSGLIAEKLSRKTVNNLLAIVSKPLKYAIDCGLITSAPRIGIMKTERPEIGAWELEEYAAILSAAHAEGPDWYAAVCLCGEAGLRVGEVRALAWSDVDMKAATITVSRQRRHGVEGTPKGRTRRTIPMTRTLIAALRALNSLRTGYVIRNLDGTPKTDGQDAKAIQRIYTRAGVPKRPRKWHLLRNTFGAHAALFGVNPWTLMRWMGHKRIDETMLYVEFAKDHHRTVPAAILSAGAVEGDPDRRIIAMLGARCSSVAVLSDANEGSATTAGG